MNKILLRRRKKAIRLIPMGINKNDADFIKMVTYFKDTMTNTMGVPLYDAECPIIDAIDKNKTIEVPMLNHTIKL